MTTRTLRNFTCALTVSALAGMAINAHAQHPAPVPKDGDPNNQGFNWTFEKQDNGKTWVYQTPTTHHPQSKPFQTSEPTNLLPTTYERMIDSGGDRIPNTLPSTPEDPYNLHPEPEVSEIDPRSPRWDLNMIINELKGAVDPEHRRAVNKQFYKNGTGVPSDPRRGRVERKGQDAGKTEPLTGRIDMERVEFAIDILEGNPIDRTYSGMALLKYKGPEKVKKVDPETNTVTVHQSWQRSRIMSDTMFIDPSTIPADEEWTVRYVVDSLHWGHEDFAPFAVFFDDPQTKGVSKGTPFFQMDQTFFPMEQGHRYVFEIDMPPHRFWNLTYTWGWRVHPPRIQAIEKATKTPGGKNIVKWESDVFGENPTADRQSQLEAISMLSDLAPAKRMWQAFRGIKAAKEQGGVPPKALQALVEEAEAAFEDWKDPHELPRGIEQAGDEYDQTIAYLNNKMYGGMHSIKNEAEQTFYEWETRGEQMKVKLKNGDYFPHAYMNVDFGGRRGWENIYQNTVALGGQGPWFTFGRTQWSQNLGRRQPVNKPQPAIIPAAKRPTTEDGTSGSGNGNAGGPGNGNGKAKGVGSLAALEDRIGHELPDVAQAGGRSVPARPETPGKPSDNMYMAIPGQETALHRVMSEGDVELGMRNVHLTFRYDPSRRLRFYQFDPLHHDQTILSIH